MEQGTISSHFVYYHIRPDATDKIVVFHEGAIYPSGTQFAVGDRVNFERYKDYPDWAKRVERA